MNEKKEKCENCSLKMSRTAHIDFNGGMTVCFPCADEWERLGKPQTVEEYARAIDGRPDYQSDLIAKA